MAISCNEPSGRRIRIGHRAASRVGPGPSGPGLAARPEHFGYRIAQAHFLCLYRPLDGCNGSRAVGGFGSANRRLLPFRMMSADVGARPIGVLLNKRPHGGRRFH
jgi:hypothetical protein